MKINRPVIFVAAFFILNCFFLFGQDNNGTSDDVSANSVPRDTDTTSKSTDSADAIATLSTEIKNLTASISSQNEKVDFMPIFAIVLSLFVLCAVIFLYLKVRRLGDQIAELSRTTEDQMAKFSRTTENQIAKLSRTIGDQIAELPRRIKPGSEQPPVAPLVKQPIMIVPPTTTAPQTSFDSISPLYSSQEKRDDRRNSQPNDVFFDIDQDTYAQIIQGRKVQLLFEKRGSYIISPFVYVIDSLYVNFHFYNENKPIPADKEKMISEAFEIIGTLPGKIIGCVPAQMRKKDDKYCVSSPGKIVLDSNV
jgi:hypothetical protein